MIALSQPTSNNANSQLYRLIGDANNQEIIVTSIKTDTLIDCCSLSTCFIKEFHKSWLSRLYPKNVPNVQLALAEQKITTFLDGGYIVMQLMLLLFLT